MVRSVAVLARIIHQPQGTSQMALTLRFREPAGASPHRTTQVIGTILNDSICVWNSGLDFLLGVVIIADRGECHHGQWSSRYATRRVDR